jgi:hypothetical protein
MPDMIVKFHRQEVLAIFNAGENVEIEITGFLDSSVFRGNSTIRVIE